MAQQLASISIHRQADDGESTEILRMTQEEYDQIISCYGTGKRFEYKMVDYDEDFERAQAAVLPNEELREENFNRVNTGGFEQTVVLLNRWSEMAMSEMFKERNFRIEINYNAKDKKSTFAIYTPMASAQDDNEQEYSER